MNVKDKVILITGAGGGLGSEMARLLCDNGAKVIIVDLDAEKGQQTADAIVAAGGQAWFIKADVTSETDWKAAVDFAVEKGGRLDVVVNNAAIIQNQKLGMVTKPLLEKMFAVNVFAVIDMMQIASRLMARTGGGSIVNIASVTGVVGSPGQVAYSSTKGAVISATKSAAKELSPMQIRVNAVAPGIIKTERFEELYEASGDKIDQRISRIALGRLGTPQDVANAVAFLASDRASYISGHILGVDGCASI